MSLSFPSTSRNRGPASYEAEQNLTQLLRVDERGNPHQVATRSALQHFQRIQNLRPGYLDGVKSWAKSGVVYVGAGVATLGAIGLTAYVAYRVISESDYALHIGAGAAGVLGIAYKMGCDPITNGSALILATVRDSANRAANSSVKRDERSWDAKDREANECHEKIVNDLCIVYNDTAKLLNEKLRRAEKSDFGRDQIALKELSEHLSNRMAAIEALLSQLNLTDNEVEQILQQMKDAVRHVQTQACQLSSKPADGRKNVELLANWPRPISEIAIPCSIKERIAAAERTRFGITGKVSGYLAAAFEMVPAAALSAGAVTAIWAGVHLYQGDLSDAAKRVETFVRNFDWNPKNWTVPTLTREQGAAALGIIVPTVAIGVKKTIDHTHAIAANTSYVERELDESKNELVRIYEGVARNLNHRATSQKIRSKLPEIGQEIQKLGFDPDEILKNLKRNI